MTRAVPLAQMNTGVVIDGPQGTQRSVLGTTAGAARWGVFVGEATAETGGNSGSHFFIARYNDAGTYIDNPFFINRATGVITFNGPVSFSTALPYLPLIGGSLSGELYGTGISVSGNITANGGIITNGFNNNNGWTVSQAPAGSGSYFVLENSAGTNMGYLSWNNANNVVAFTNATGGGVFYINADGTGGYNSAFNVAGGFSAGNAAVTGLTVNGGAVLNNYLNVAGSFSAGNSTVTGLTVNGGAVLNNYLNVAGVVTAAAGIHSNDYVTAGGGMSAYGNITLQQQGGGDFYLTFNAGATWRGSVGCHGAGDSGVGIYTNYGSGALYIDTGGSFFYAGGNSNAYKVNAGSWLGYSDARIKNVGSEYTQGLDAILQLRPVSYTYRGNDTPTEDVNAIVTEGDISKPTASAAPYPASMHYNAANEGREFIGLVAQEMEAIFPDMVTQGNGFIDGVAVTDLRTVDPSNLIYALINAVKELSAKVTALEGAR